MGWALVVATLGVVLGVAVPWWLLLLFGAAVHVGAGVYAVLRGISAFDPPSQRGRDAF
jgi:hypothetical protein